MLMRRESIQVPRDAYIAVAFMDDGSNLTDFLVDGEQDVLGRHTSTKYCTDYLKAKQIAKSRFGSKASRVVIAQVKGLLDMGCTDLLDRYEAQCCR